MLQRLPTQRNAVVTLYDLVEYPGDHRQQPTCSDKRKTPFY